MAKLRPLRLKLLTESNTSSVSLSRDALLLLACACTSLAPEREDLLRDLMGQPRDWEFLAELADRHGVAMQLYCALASANPIELPPAVLQALRIQFEGNVRRNLFLTGELLKILKAFARRGLRVLPYKGPVQAAMLYGNVGLRDMSDLDLLIKQDHFPAAKDILHSLGYRPALAHTRKQHAARMTCDSEYEFISSDGNVCVDLHWAIVSPHMGIRLRFDDFWHRRRFFLLGGEEVATFSSEDTVLTLAVHGGKHLWQRICWLIDFAECLRQSPELDWAALLPRARAAHGERMLLLALSLAEDVIDVELPRELSTTVNAHTAVKGIAARIEQNLFRPEPQIERDGTRWLALLLLADSGWDRVRSAARFALSSGPREWKAVPLPDSLFAFYPLVRIAGLLRRAPSLFSRSPAPAEARGRMQKN